MDDRIYLFLFAAGGLRGAEGLSRLFELLAKHRQFFSPERFGADDSVPLLLGDANPARLVALWRDSFPAEERPQTLMLAAPEKAADLLLQWSDLEAEESDQGLHLRLRLSRDQANEREFLVQFLSFVIDLYVLTAPTVGYASAGSELSGETGAGLAISADTAGLSLLPRDLSVWANLLGPARVAELGLASLRVAPAQTVQELPDGGVLLLAYEHPLDCDLPQARQKRRALREYLADLAPGRIEESEARLPPEVETPEVGHRSTEVDLWQEPTPPVVVDPDHFLANVDVLILALRERMGPDGERLDFTPESLTVLDRYVAAGYRQSPREDAPIAEIAAYLGEMVHRNLGGEWFRYEPFHGRQEPAVRFTQNGRPRIEVPLFWAQRVWEDHRELLAKWYERLSPPPPRNVLNRRLSKREIRGLAEDRSQGCFSEAGLTMFLVLVLSLLLSFALR